MTKTDVAAMLRCCERTVERQVKLNAFPPPQRFGKEALWFESVVFAWLKKRRDQQQQWVPDQVPGAEQPPEAHPTATTSPPAVTSAKKLAKSRGNEWSGHTQARPKFQSAPP